MKIDADAAGLDATRLERLTEHLQHQYIEPGRIPGCQLAVARSGEVGYFRSFGNMDRERSKPVTDDTPTKDDAKAKLAEEAIDATTCRNAALGGAA